MLAGRGARDEVKAEVTEGLALVVGNRSQPYTYGFPGAHLCWTVGLGAAHAAWCQTC